MMKYHELSGRELDYEMYKHACQAAGREATQAEFDYGYEREQYHFHQDKALLLDLMETYCINAQYLADEWLASNTQGSCWGHTPLIAVCRLVLTLAHR